MLWLERTFFIAKDWFVGCVDRLWQQARTLTDNRVNVLRREALRIWSIEHQLAADGVAEPIAQNVSRLVHAYACAHAQAYGEPVDRAVQQVFDDLSGVLGTLAPAIVLMHELLENGITFRTHRDFVFWARERREAAEGEIVDEEGDREELLLRWMLRDVRKHGGWSREHLVLAQFARELRKRGISEELLPATVARIREDVRRYQERMKSESVLESFFCILEELSQISAVGKSGLEVYANVAGLGMRFPDHTGAVRWIRSAWKPVREYYTTRGWQEAWARDPFWEAIRTLRKCSTASKKLFIGAPNNIAFAFKVRDVGGLKIGQALTLVGLAASRFHFKQLSELVERKDTRRIRELLDAYKTGLDQVIPAVELFVPSGPENGSDRIN